MPSSEDRHERSRSRKEIIMKKIVTLALAALLVVMALALTACGPKYNTVDQIKENGKLVVYTEAGFAPYEFVYENDIVGVDIEIMKKVAEKLGVDYKDMLLQEVCLYSRS